jgi:basic amino acid/polyamine antiporter, APA family
LTYYAIGHWSALAQPQSERFLPPAIPIIGLVVCVGVVVTLPWLSLVVAAVSLLTGVVWFTVAQAKRHKATP